MHLESSLYERLLRGSAAAKSIPRRRRLHCCRRVHDSNRLGRVSSVGTAELEFAASDCALVNRLSDRANPGLGLRHDAARNSRRGGRSFRQAPAQRYRLDCGWSRDFSRCRIFVFPRSSASGIGKSIAVLPFQNLSDEKENAYFADGIQDDILTNLSKIGALKVISRTSVMSYRAGGTRSAREIGRTLGVATLLEGSVRRIGNRVRVNVQLVDAEKDEHLWAEDYDRDLTDVLAIQTDLAKRSPGRCRQRFRQTKRRASIAGRHRIRKLTCCSCKRMTTRTGPTTLAMQS